MPLYEYRCSKCEKTFEVIQKFVDAPLTEHETCGGTVLRLMSAPSFHLKGSGWYATDYAKGGKASSESSLESKNGEAKPKDGESTESKSAEGKSKPIPSESKSGAESKSESKTESKPAATPAKSD